MSTRRPTLTAQLRALSRHEHSDFSIGGEAADVIEGLGKALSELLDAFDCEPDDLMPHEYEAIVADAKTRARAALSKARGETT